MENKMSVVCLIGLVKNIDLEKRDVVVTTVTPVKKKEVDVTVHFWKTSADNQNQPAFSGRSEWKEDIAIGDKLVIKGHMGNSGRVIATGYSRIPQNENTLVESIVDEGGAA